MLRFYLLICFAFVALAEPVIAKTWVQPQAKIARQCPLYELRKVIPAPEQSSASFSTANKMQNEVRKGQAPRDVERVDPAHTLGGEPHVHYTDGTSSNQSGSVHDAHRGLPKPTGKTKEWLKAHGWNLPAQ